MTGPRPIASTPADLRRVMRTRLRGQRRSSGPRSARRSSRPSSIAGAGSGKTSLMAARVVWLVATGQVTPDQVLGLTFTTKAAGELRSRIREALERGRLRPAA